MTDVQTVHNIPEGYMRLEATDLDGVLYEGWAYDDGRPVRFGVDCEPVKMLPWNNATALAVTLATTRAARILAS